MFLLQETITITLSLRILVILIIILNLQIQTTHLQIITHSRVKPTQLLQEVAVTAAVVLHGEAVVEEADHQEVHPVVEDLVLAEALHLHHQVVIVGKIL